MGARGERIRGESRVSDDPLRDFAAVTPIQRAASVFVVTASSPIKTLKDLVAKFIRNEVTQWRQALQGADIAVD